MSKKLNGGSPIWSIKFYWREENDGFMLQLMLPEADRLGLRKESQA